MKDWMQTVAESVHGIDRVADVESEGWSLLRIWIDEPDARIPSIGPITDDGKQVRSPLFEAIARAGGLVFSAGHNPDREQFYVYVVADDDGRVSG